MARTGTGGRAEGDRDTGPRSRRVLVLLALAVVCALVLAPPLRLYLQQQRDIAGLRDEITAREQDVEGLSTEVDLWQEDAYVAAQARDRLNFVMPGETGFVVPDPEPTEGGTDGRTAPGTRPARTAPRPRSRPPGPTPRPRAPGTTGCGPASRPWAPARPTPSSTPPRWATAPVAEPDQRDLDAVTRQLGRLVRGVVEVAHRCSCGDPDVVRTLPRLPDGTPSPPRTTSRARGPPRPSGRWSPPA